MTFIIRQILSLRIFAVIAIMDIILRKNIEVVNIQWFLWSQRMSFSRELSNLLIVKESAIGND